MKLVRVLVVGVGVGGAGESHESDMSDVSEVGVVGEGGGSVTRSNRCVIEIYLSYYTCSREYGTRA